jgi:hypothetical protein
MASYEFNYTVQLLRQAIAFAEVEHDFGPLRRWTNEIEQTGSEMKAVAARLNQIARQDFLLTTLQSVAVGSLSPEEAGRKIRLWLNKGQTQEVEAGTIQPYLFA